ncbi:Motile sperm domain-containing protein 2 [Halotydeus destructor]|nr:Motile sperm domain-containing protein 2 [Halotydeus destructor]
MSPHCDENDNSVSYDEYWQDGAVIGRIREKFLDQVDQERELYDEEDIAKNVRNSDFFIQRFLIKTINESSHEDECLDKLKKCFKWRKETVVSLSDQSFPHEFYQTGGLFIYEQDKDGTPLLYMRIRLIKKSSELEEHMKRFLLYKINVIDSLASKLQSWGVVFDCSGIGFANVQLDMMRFLITTLREYFPCGVKYICVYEIPWILTGVQKVVFAMVPEEAKQLVQFKNKKNITSLIAKEHLPDYMGGSCRVNYHAVPAQVTRSFFEIYADVYNQREMDRIQKYFDNLMEDEKAST